MRRSFSDSLWSAFLCLPLVASCGQDPNPGDNPPVEELPPPEPEDPTATRTTAEQAPRSAAQSCVSESQSLHCSERIGSRLEIRLSKRITLSRLGA